MPQYRLLADFDQRLGADDRFLGKAGSEAARQYHGFQGNGLLQRVRADLPPFRITASRTHVLSPLWRATQVRTTDLPRKL
jgi:hypothetical protein